MNKIRKLIIEKVWPLLLLKEWIIGFACWLEKRFPYSDQFSFEAPYKYMSLHFVFRCLLKVIFYTVKVEVSKETLQKFNQFLKNGQLVICPTHTFIMEVVPIYELLGKAKQPFFLMVAREFFDLVLGLAEFPLKSAGCFSVARGSKDAKKSLKFAFNILSNTRRPLIMFPEGESSLNLKSLLPLKKGAGLIAQEISQLDKPIFLLPLSFKFTYKDSIRTEENFLEILEEIEEKLRIKKLGSTYQERTLTILDNLINTELNSFGISSSESLISKAKLLYDTIHNYFQTKYSYQSLEERSYEVIVKEKNEEDKEKDLDLIYTWIEIKALLNYLPSEKEADLALWGALLLKILRIVNKDYSERPVNRIIKGLIIEPILGEPIPNTSFKDLSIEENIDLIKTELEKLI